MIQDFHRLISACSKPLVPLLSQHETYMRNKIYKKKRIYFPIFKSPALGYKKNNLCSSFHLLQKRDKNLCTCYQQKSKVVLCDDRFLSFFVVVSTILSAPSVVEVSFVLDQGEKCTQRFIHGRHKVMFLFSQPLLIARKYAAKEFLRRIHRTRC